MLALGGFFALCGCDGAVDAVGREPSPAVERDWPSFRGRFARGVAEGFEVPLDWDLTSGRNVLWRTPLPGLAASSPVVVGGRLFVTDAVPVGMAGAATGEPVFRLEQDGGDRRGYGWIRSLEQEGEHRFEVVCLDKADGRVLWRRTAHEGAPHSKRHPKGTHANPTPAADAHRVVAFFGAEGVHCFDHDGELLWRRDLGKLVGGYYVNPNIQWGIGSSPVLHEDRVVLQCDVLEQPFLIALDARTGETVWRAERADAPGWGTPTIDVGADRRQVIVNGYEHVGGYDLDTGEILWSMAGGGAVPIPTPVVADGLIYLTSSGGMPGGKGPQAQRSPIYAIPTGAVGELDVERHLAWAHPAGGNYIPTPLVYGGELYCLNRAILTCLDARTGALRYKHRLSGGSEFSASPVAADGKLYLVSEEGRAHVLRAGPDYEVLAESDLGAPCLATPAISEGVLFFRTLEGVVAVGTPPPAR